MQGKIGGIALEGTVAEWREILQSFQLAQPSRQKKTPRTFPSKDGRDWKAIFKEAMKSPNAPSINLPESYSDHQYLARYFPTIHSEQCHHHNCPYKLRQK